MVVLEPQVIQHTPLPSSFSEDERSLILVGLQVDQANLLRGRDERAGVCGHLHPPSQRQAQGLRLSQRDGGKVTLMWKCFMIFTYS